MADIPSAKIIEGKRHSGLIDLLIRLVKEKPLGTVGGIITFILLLTGIFAPWLAPYSPTALSGTRLLPPSAHFWLGTDDLGRDLLSRIIFGARISVVVGLGASIIASIIETVLGILTGYIGGTFDLIIQRFVDAVMCFPGLILMMV